MAEKLEILIARPPTRKCRELIAVMEKVVRRHQTTCGSSSSSAASPGRKSRAQR